MTITIRPARMEDAEALVALINPIIRAGGTTAIEQEISLDDQRLFIAASTGKSLFHVAEADGGVIGFQTVTPNKSLPEDVGDIATFVARGRNRNGVGQQLAEATFAAAKAAGWRELNATIRADNAQGLGYYKKIGFRETGRTAAIPLTSGAEVDRIHHRRPL